MSETNPPGETLAPNALTTLDAALSALGIEPDEPDPRRDEVLTRLINSASAFIERAIGRRLGKAEYTQRFFAHGQQELILPQWPILSVAYAHDVSDGRRIDPDAYDIAAAGDIGVLYKDTGWPFAAYRDGLAYDPARHKRCIEVRYTAGYVLPKDATPEAPATLPFDLQTLALEMLQQEWGLMQSGAQGLSAFSISDVSWTFDKNPRQKWLDTIAMYKRVGVA